MGLKNIEQMIKRIMNQVSNITLQLDSNTYGKNLKNTVQEHFEGMVYTIPSILVFVLFYRNNANFFNMPWHPTYIFIGSYVFKYGLKKSYYVIFYNFLFSLIVTILVSNFSIHLWDLYRLGKLLLNNGIIIVIFAFTYAKKAEKINLLNLEYSQLLRRIEVQSNKNEDIYREIDLKKEEITNSSGGLTEFTNIERQIINLPKGKALLKILKMIHNHIPFSDAGIYIKVNERLKRVFLKGKIENIEKLEINNSSFQEIVDIKTMGKQYIIPLTVKGEFFALIYIEKLFYDFNNKNTLKEMTEIVNRVQKLLNKRSDR